MVNPDNHIHNTRHTRKVRDFWQKLLLLMVTAHLQGPDDVIVSRVRVGETISNYLDKSNINWRVRKFFAKKNEKMAPPWTDFKKLDDIYEYVKTEIEKGNITVPGTTVDNLIGRKLKGNHKDPVCNNSGYASGFPHADIFKKRNFENAEGQYLFRIAVAFGFCPKFPRNYLKRPGALPEEDCHNPREYARRRWMEELQFDPERFDDWAAKHNEPIENQQACAIWNAFAGAAPKGGTDGLWGQLFEKFKIEWYKRVGKDFEADRAGVLVDEENMPVMLYESVNVFKKKNPDTNRQADRTATNSPGEVIPVDNENSALDLRWPRKAPFPEDLIGFNRLMYTSGIGKFVGREDEIKLLHDFTGDTSSGGQVFNFRWMLLTGDTGAGKTMLACHFSEEELDGGWYSGKLDFASLKAFHYPDKCKWRPVRPTFIVIDNVECVPEEVGELLRVFTDQAVNFENPVRLLLLARSTYESWTDKLLPDSGYRPVIEQHNFGGHRILGREIKPLSRDAIFKLMKQRIQAADLDVPEKNYLLSKARDIDRRVETPRPLFAALAVEHYIETRRIGQDLPERFELTTVLEGFIRRERASIWRETITTDGELRRYEMGLAVATLAQGIKLRDLNKANFGSGYSWLEIPIPPNDDSGALAAFGCTGSYWPQKEPDLVGEYFISQKLTDAKLDKEERVALIEGAVLLGESQAVITLLRLARDFPERFKQLHLEEVAVAAAPEHKRVLLSLTNLAIELIYDKLVLDSSVATRIFDAVFEREEWRNWRELGISIAKTASNISFSAGAVRDWDRITEVLVRLDAIRMAFPQDEMIALAEANAAVNISSSAGEVGDWGRVAKMMARIDALRMAFPQDQEIVRAEAKAAVNISNSAEASGVRGRVAEMMARLDALRKAFPRDCEIALAEAKAAAYISNSAEASGDRGRVAEMMAKIDALRMAFPRDREIARTEAMAAFNISNSASAAGDWGRVAKMMARLDALRKAFPWDQEIARTEAMAAVNISNSASAAGDWGRVAKMMARLDALRKAFPWDQEIAWAEAVVAFNISKSASAAGDRGRVAELVARFDALRKAFPQDQKIARVEAMAAVNISNSAEASGVRDRVAEMMARLDALRKAFPRDCEIALAEAKAAAYISNSAEASGVRDRVAEMMARLDALRKAFPRDCEIALAEAKAAAYISNSAEASGDRDRVAEMMARLDALRKAFPQDQEIAWAEAVVAFNISKSASAAGDRGRVAELVARFDALRKAFPQDQKIALAEAKAAAYISNSAEASGDRDRVAEMMARFDALRKAFPQDQEIARAWAMVVVNISNLSAGTVTHLGEKVGRNQPCPCGSGKKVKQCCGRRSKLH